MTDGPTGDYSKSDKALSKPSKSTFSIWVSDLDPGDYRGSGLVQRALRNIQPGSRGSFRLGAGKLDHLGPLLGFVGDKLSEVGGRDDKHRCSQIGKPRFQLRIGEGTFVERSRWHCRAARETF